MLSYFNKLHVHHIILNNSRSQGVNENVVTIFSSKYIRIVRKLLHQKKPPPLSLEIVKKEAELYGLSTALDNLSIAVEQTFREELSAFERRWKSIDDVKSTEYQFGTQCKDFIEKVEVVRGKAQLPSELSSALYHPSFQTNFANVFRRAQLKGNVRTLPSASAGHILIDLAISLFLHESKWTDDRSVGAFSNASRFLGSFALTEKFWVESRFGTPLVGRGFTEEKGLLDKAYKRLVHTIFMYEGFAETKEFILQSLRPKHFLSEFAEDIEFGDGKTLLQEYCQDLGLKPPKYIYQRDPKSLDHEPTFHVSVRLPRVGVLTVDADSKHEGAKKVADRAISQLRQDKHSRASLMQLLAKKSSSAAQRRKSLSVHSLPEQIFKLKKCIEGEFGIEPDLFRLFQALKTKSKTAYHHLPDNEILSKIGASVIEFSIINSHPDAKLLGVAGVHPRVCDKITALFSLKRISQEIFNPTHDWGVNVDRQIAQSVMFSLFINEQQTFFAKIKPWFRMQEEFSNAIDPTVKGVRLPDTLDERFSYMTVLQEHVQKTSPILPKYSKITNGPSHMPTHSAICEYDGRSTKGTSTRFTWAKNIAAFHMLNELGYLE